VGLFKISLFECTVDNRVWYFIYQESKLKAARMSIYVRRGGPNYQTGLAKMRALGEEIGIPIEVPMCRKSPWPFPSVHVKK
jgi:3-deoxy-D-manno-octulosonic acid (KDO) 8-phosphate synthase